MYIDRDEHDWQQALASCQQLEHFTAIAAGIDKSIASTSSIELAQREEKAQIAELKENFVRKPSIVQPNSEAQSADRSRVDASLNSLKRTLGGGPRDYLVAVTNRADNAIRSLLARTGFAALITSDPGANALILAQKGYINADLGNAASRFFGEEVRLLGNASANRDELIGASKNGSQLLEKFAEVPMARNVVADFDVPLYADEAGQKLLPGVGVILDVTESNGVHDFRIYPTTRVGYYSKGMEVSWEWRFGPTWGQAYYLDKTSNKIILAFNGSANFIGRNLRELLIATK